MLAISARLNPECEHVAGDMRSLRLGRTFDAVFVHDAVSYITTLPNLEHVAATAYVHTRPGGAALFVLDCVRETFAPDTESSGHDGADGRALRYLEWTHDLDPSGTTFAVDFACLLRDRDGSIRTVHDRHVNGVFALAEWRAALATPGFAVDVVLLDPPVHETQVMFACRRPAAGAPR